MEKTALLPLVGAGTSGAPVVGRTGQSPSSPPPTPPQPVADARKAESEVQFLARQAAAEVSGGLRETFAKFTVDQETHQVSVEIIDANSQEVLRTIPNGDLRRMAQQFRASQGLVLDSAV